MTRSNGNTIKNNHPMHNYQYSYYITVPSKITLTFLIRVSSPILALLIHTLLRTLLPLSRAPSLSISLYLSLSLSLSLSFSLSFLFLSVSVSFSTITLLSPYSFSASIAHSFSLSVSLSLYIYICIYLFHYIVITFERCARTRHVIIIGIKNSTRISVV